MESKLGRKLFDVFFLIFWVPTTYALCRLIGYPRENAMLDRGIALSDWEHYDKAVRYLTRMISVFPNNPRAYYERGMALLNLDRHDEAIQNFGLALEISPIYPGALVWRARARIEIGDHQGAAEDRLADLHADPWGRNDGMGVSPYQWRDCAESLILAGRKSEAEALLVEYFAQYSQNVTEYDWHETAPMRLFAKLLRACP